jgi:hypothetical protein
VKHARMIVIHTKMSLAQPCRDMSGGWDPNPISRLPRPMSNLLRPAGLVPRSSWNASRSTADLPVRETDPMPAHAGTWISDGGKARRLLTEELAKGLGVPKSWGDLTTLNPRFLGWQTCSHIYEWLGNVLASADASTDDDGTNTADDGGPEDFPAEELPRPKPSSDASACDSSPNETLPA